MRRSTPHRVAAASCDSATQTGALSSQPVPGGGDPANHPSDRRKASAFRSSRINLSTVVACRMHNHPARSPPAHPPFSLCRCSSRWALGTAPCGAGRCWAKRGPIRLAASGDIAPTAMKNSAAWSRNQVRRWLTGGGRRIRTVGPSPKDPPYAGWAKKSVERQLDAKNEAWPTARQRSQAMLPFTRARNLTSPQCPTVG